MVTTWEQFENVQPIVMQMLKNSLRKNRTAHAYMFEGMRGTGKKEAGLLFAKSLFCQHVKEGYLPCEECHHCKRISNGNHPDVHIIEPDGMSIKKEQIKALQEEFTKTGVESKKKFYMIVHTDKMTTNAANSLLKFLEEPNSETTAVLVTEQIHRILPTIISRCQVISFHPLPKDVLQQQLEHAGVHPHFSALLAQLTNNTKEALQLSNDEWFAQARKIVLKLYEVLHKSPFEAMVFLQMEWYEHFRDKQQLDLGLDLLLLVYRDVLHYQLGKEAYLFPDQQEKLQSSALHVSGKKITEQMSSILEAKRRLHVKTNTQLLMEQLVLKLQGGSSFV
ncbi:DNA polymerase III subunit delta' [Aeribacillus pallidus]|uniref:DNA polymerase III subunit delta' n=1 Tax=Aeribacillus pallidus TaxID=33936 RepID=UPI003D196677